MTAPSRPQARRRQLYRLGALAALALYGLDLATPSSSASTFTGRCVGVIDGDSIEVLSGGVAHQIRLEGIDAPERGQPFSTRAKQTLSDLIYGKDVRVAGTTTDQYGRLVARVRVGDLDTSLEMIRQGLAWHYKRYSSEAALADAESVARARRVGLWGDPAAVPPWAYRRGSRLPSTPPGAESADSQPATPGEVHGNTSSRVFHVAACPNFRCRNCTARFPDAAAARAAGYRPAGCCHPGPS